MLLLLRRCTLSEMARSHPHHDHQLGDISVTVPVLAAGRVLGEVRRSGSEQARRRAALFGRAMFVAFVAIPVLLLILNKLLGW